MSRKLAFDVQSIRPSGQLTPDRHCELLGPKSYRRGLILTWEGNGGPVDVPIILGIAEVLDHETWRGAHLTRMIDMLNTRKTLIGRLNVGTDHTILPFQFLWGIEDFANKHATHLGHALPQSSDDASPALRLMCLRTPGRPKPKVTDERRKHWSPDVVASIEMSSTAKVILLDQEVDGIMDEEGRSTERWLGTPADLTRCREAIVNGIWTDAKHELNAWQQLYVLACVKTYLGRMWTSEQEDHSLNCSSGEESESSDFSEID